MKKINDDLSINVLNIAAVEKRDNKCFLFMMDGDKYELTENDYDVIAAEIPTLKVDDNLYVNPNAVLTVETIYKDSNADHSIIKLVGDNVTQVTLAEGAIVAAMEPTSGGGSGSDSASCFSLYDLFDYVDGKHVDVDALVALLEAKGLYPAGETYPFYFEIGAHYQGAWSDYVQYMRVLCVFNNSSSYLGILNQNYEVDSGIETRKNDIESYVYEKSALHGLMNGSPDLIISLVAIAESADRPNVVFTYEEIKSIFVE